MAEKSEFYGDVGQVVVGTVQEAPRLSNVVTLNIGEQEKAVELITPFQRSRIKVLVNELAALIGEDTLTIYKGLITDYGLERFKELPRHKYQEVKAKLEEWIREAGTPSRISVPAVVPVPGQQLLPAHAHGTLPCVACAEKSASFMRLQRTARLQLIALVACLAACGWLLYKAPNVADHASAQADDKCYIAGKSYSIGYALKAAASAAVECVGAMDGVSAMWKPVSRRH